MTTHEQFCQLMLDNLGAIQEEWPMAEDGREALWKDIAFTNDKNGWHLSAPWLESEGEE